MKIIDIPGGQGSRAWHEHRRTHDNASDAAAMMGCDTNRTRNQLLHELHTGLRPEFSDYAQEHVIDEGHRCEALARPLAEAIVGEDLYPIVVANGRMSASLDGATLMGEVNFEHKRLNAALRDAMVGEFTGADLPLMYRVQMEHQLHCSGAARTLFMASEWNGDRLVEERHCWYLPDPALRAQVLAGWAQFAADLAAYVPRAAAPAVVAAPQEHLPVVSVRMDGTLKVVSNLDLFGTALKAFIERIPVKPSTDQEFADTDAACKSLKRAEEALEQAEGAALASIGDVEAMRRLVAEFRNLAKTTRLQREKLVEQRKAEIKTEIVQGGLNGLIAHVRSLNRMLDPRIDYMPPIASDFQGVIKGLRTLDSLRNAVDTELARAKIDASAKADRINANLLTINEAGPEAQALFADKRDLVLKDPEAVAAIVSQRVAEHRAAEQRRIEAERERIRAEGQPPQQVLKAEPAAADATDRGTAADVSPRGGAMGAGQPAAAGPAVGVFSHEPVKLGDINAALGFDLREAFVRETLGVIPVDNPKGRAILIAGDDMPRLFHMLRLRVDQARAALLNSKPAPPAAPATVPAPKAPPPPPAPAQAEPVEAQSKAVEA